MKIKTAGQGNMTFSFRMEGNEWVAFPVWRYEARGKLYAGPDTAWRDPVLLRLVKAENEVVVGERLLLVNGDWNPQSPNTNYYPKLSTSAIVEVIR